MFTAECLLLGVVDFFFIPRASFVPVLVVLCGFGDSDSPSVNGLFLGKQGYDF